MKRLKYILTALLLLSIVTTSCSQKNTPGNSSVLGTFVASTPCSEGTRPLPGIPVDADCALIHWKLTLYKDEVKDAPATYTLHCRYGLPRQGTTGFIGGGKTLELEGPVTMVKGTSTNPNTIVYRLKDTKTNKTISFVKPTGDLLHLLDSDDRLMIGSAAWSYTLNRTGQ